MIMHSYKISDMHVVIVIKDRGRPISFSQLNEIKGTSVDDCAATTGQVHLFCIAAPPTKSK